MDLTPDEIKNILEKHLRWLRGEADGSRADLRNANLRNADLDGANLVGANLVGANLGGANLGGADLRSANLRGADLRGADLRSANLGDANLGDADLMSANLGDANLRDADLRGAKNADLAIAMTRILPAGTLIGWKKCQGGVIVKLEIPAYAKRSSAFGRKCRAEFAKVLEVIGAEEGVSTFSNDKSPVIHYRVGETVRPALPFNEDFTIECASGVHFWITREEAEAM
jgi:hypothetical protein